LRTDGASALSEDDLRLALGLAWAADDHDLVRATLAGFPSARVQADPVLAALWSVTHA
jgi:hypothetical protein